VRRHLVHIGLFLATCASTWYAGGLEFAATLMAILTTHELGHWLAARHHGVPASLPYFIPVPFIGTGTLGAIIKMDRPIDERLKLIDVGAAGPLAGFVVALPLLCWGLVTSPMQAIVVPEGGAAIVEGNSLLYLGLKYAIHGRLLPDASGLDVSLSPMAFAAWVGLLVTFINLIPVGQLDGGHVAVAYFGERWERVAPWLHRLMPLIGLAAWGHMFLEARGRGLDAAGAAEYGLSGGAPWLVWSVMLLLMRRVAAGRYHPPVGDEPLPRSRRVLFWVVALLFVLIFVPVPLRMWIP
jgi:membrane-associated protease RseP (regulator of RpoE activity)